MNDPIGTPERLVGSDGEVACELTRTAWGETEERPGGKASTSLRFQGQYEDEKTGLSYNRWRYYDPEGERFVSQDVIGLLGGLHSYRYVTNPFSWIDPFGLNATDLPILKPGSPAWKSQVKDMKKPGGGRDCRVASQEEAEQLLSEGRGQLPRKGSEDDPYNHGGDPYKAGYEVHPSEETSQNAPQNNLPHIKWKDWSGGKSTGGAGHIFFG